MQKIDKDAVSAAVSSLFLTEGFVLVWLLDLSLDLFHYLAFATRFSEHCFASHRSGRSVNPGGNKFGVNSVAEQTGAEPHVV